MTKWLLVERFSGDVAAPSVVGVGNSARNFVPLRTLLRGRTLTEVERAINEVRDTNRPLDSLVNGRRVIAAPLRTFAGNLHGLWVWAGPEAEQPPVRDPAGAWQFNLTTDRISGSDDLLDLYGVPRGADRQSERHTAEAFGRLVTNADEAAAMAKMVRAEPGTEHQATWTVRRDDGDLRAAHFSARMLAEDSPTRGRQVVLRGITEDLGPAAAVRSAPPPVILAAQVVASLAEPGSHRGLLNLRTLKLLRWLDTDEPMPNIAWAYDAADTVDHWIHPDDHEQMHRLAEQLVAGKASGNIRFRTRGRDWQPVYITLSPVLLDQHTTAALLTMHQQNRER